MRLGTKKPSGPKKGKSISKRGEAWKSTSDEEFILRSMKKTSIGEHEGKNDILLGVEFSSSLDSKKKILRF